jgi:hypothetical protein
MEKRI